MIADRRVSSSPAPFFIFCISESLCRLTSSVAGAHLTAAMALSIIIEHDDGFSWSDIELEGELEEAPDSESGTASRMQVQAQTDPAQQEARGNHRSARKELKPEQKQPKQNQAKRKRRRKNNIIKKPRLMSDVINELCGVKESGFKR